MSGWIEFFDRKMEAVVQWIDEVGNELLGRLGEWLDNMSEGFRNKMGNLGNSIRNSASNLTASMKGSLSPNVPAGKSDPSPARGISPDVTPSLPTKEQDTRFSGLLESYGIERGNLGFQVADVGPSAWEGQAKLGCAAPRLQTAGIGF